MTGDTADRVRESTIHIFHDLLMIVMRVGWIFLAVVAVLLGIGAANSPMLQIVDCEIDMFSPEVPNREACHASIRSYFGNVVVPVLALPVVVCLIPVFMPRQRVAWLTTAALFVLSVVGFFAVVFSSTPTSTDLLGFFWPAAFLAVLVTSLVQLVNLIPCPQLRTRKGSGPVTSR
ncbi:hypothetical protein [Rhodococcus sp. (in: high G+C Gram-positive bacteria)]|uniref:hypothetical protein n=1 Tax=Rhodococcus sp. TaxID=1831 RepID=UPI00388F32A9